MKSVQINDDISEKLDEISKRRKGLMHPVRTKQQIVEDAIKRLFNREVK